MKEEIKREIKKVKKKVLLKKFFLCRDRNELLPIYSVMLCTFNNPLFMLLSFSLFPFSHMDDAMHYLLFVIERVHPQINM